MYSQYAFYFLSVVAIVSALMVVFSRNPVYSVLSLIVTFFAVAGHYFLLNAQFLAAVHIIVYAGAIMVLFLYVIMMMNLNKESEPRKSMLAQVGAVTSGGMLFLVMVVALRSAENLQIKQPSNDNIGLIENLGTVLYRDYALPFEISAILFLAGMVGAVLIGKKTA